MKTKEASIAAAVLIAAFAASTANAVPIQFDETFTLSTPEVLSGRSDFFSYQHFLTPQLGGDRVLEVTVDGTAAPGESYSSATDTLLGGSLTLWFRGEGQWTTGTFEVLLSVTSVDSGNFASVFTVGQDDFLVSAITSAGVLDVTLRRTNAAHTAQLDKSMLTVFGERGVQSPTAPLATVAVPEPATFALLGIGLLGIGLTSRKTRVCRKA
jgi:hypothetical protein